MYEHRAHRLLPWPEFLWRATRHFSWGALFGLTAVLGGTIGYHVLADLAWVDAFLNASMIVGGMGPVDPMPTTPAKLFAACYALFSGVVFVGAMGVILAPWVHRMMHTLHADR